MEDNEIEDNKMAEKTAVFAAHIPTGAGKDENQFTKEQLLCSKRFRERQDMIAALLTDGEQYTVKAVEQKIEDYRKGKVE